MEMVKGDATVVIVSHNAAILREICDRVIFNNYRIIQVKHSSVYHNEHSATKTNGVFDKYLLLFKRYYHMGWSRVYLKRKRNRPNVLFFILVI